MRPWNQSLVHRTSGVMLSHKCIPSTEAHLHRSFNHGAASRWSGGFQDKAITLLVNNKVMCRWKLIFFPKPSTYDSLLFCKWSYHSYDPKPTVLFHKSVKLMTLTIFTFSVLEYCYFFCICVMAILIFK